MATRAALVTGTRRVLALSVWAFGIWVILTWTRTLEQLVFGAVASVLVALALAPIGPVAEPWRFLVPRRLIALVRLLVACLWRILVANLGLARRIWDPRRPLAPGMVIVPTQMSDDAGLAGVGLLTSLIVDNQIVDVDRKRNALQYHAVAVPDGSPEAVRGSVNGPIEALLERIR